jgi:phosphinothricin acetyltransferase
MLELGAAPTVVTAHAGVELRPLQAADWPAVSEIYWDGMRTGLATFEVEVPSWDVWDAAHLPGHRFVAERYGEIVGWVALGPASTRWAYRGVAEVTLYVAAPARRSGVGRALLEAAVANSEAEGIWTLQTSVFPENGASLGLLGACGFRVVGRRARIAKRDGIWRDTFLLERRSPVVT